MGGHGSGCSGSRGLRVIGKRGELRKIGLPRTHTHTAYLRTAPLSCARCKRKQRTQTQISAPAVRSSTTSPLLAALPAPSHPVLSAVCAPFSPRRRSVADDVMLSTHTPPSACTAAQSKRANTNSAPRVGCLCRVKRPECLTGRLVGAMPTR